MRVSEEVGVDPELMMKTPYRRFLGYQRVLLRRSIEQRNQAARKQFEQAIAQGR